MNRTLTSAALRLPPLQQPAARRPHLRLVGGREEWAPPLRLPRPPRPHPAPATPPLPLDQEDAERWDGLS